MRVEPNKKMVYLHISAYKSIIADLRDEIDKLKTQLHTELTDKGGHQTITKTPQDIYKIQEEEFEESKIKYQPTQQVALKTTDCKCESRVKDEEEKRLILTEIALSYEEIIQLE